MSALAEFNISSIAPPILIVGMTMLLAHFFNDADRHRGYCEKLRAKYLLVGKGPLDYLAENLTREKLQVEIFEDFLVFRLIKIHFGIISSIITLGLSLLVLIIGNAALSCCLGSKYFFSLSFIAITFFVLLVQFAYIEQQGGTARRLDEIQKIDLGGKGCFERVILESGV